MWERGFTRKDTHLNVKQWKRACTFCSRISEPVPDGGLGFNREQQRSCKPLDALQTSRVVWVAKVLKVTIGVTYQPPEDGEDKKWEEECVEENGDGVAPREINHGDVDVGQETTSMFRQAWVVDAVVAVLGDCSLQKWPVRKVGNTMLSITIHYHPLPPITTNYYRFLLEWRGCHGKLTNPVLKVNGLTIKNFTHSFRLFFFCISYLNSWRKAQ